MVTTANVTPVGEDETKLFKMSSLQKDGLALRTAVNQLISDLLSKYDNKIQCVYTGDIGFLADELYFERDI